MPVFAYLPKYDIVTKKIMKKILHYFFPRWYPSDTSKNRNKLTETQLEQNEKKRKLVASIIDGDYKRLADKNLYNIHCDSAIQAFAEWQKLQKSFYDNASKNQINALKMYMEKREYHKFLVKYSLDVLDSQEYEIFLKDIFTEPFSSLNDMDVSAIGIQMTEIMVLNGISEAGARDSYCIYQRGRFVNHSMTQGIIWFDLYKKKEKHKSLFCKQA